MAAKHTFCNQRGSVSLETAIVTPVIVALVGIIVLAGSLAQRQVQLQSAAEAYVAHVARGASMSAIDRLQTEFQFLLTRQDHAVVCAQAQSTSRKLPLFLSSMLAWLPELPPATACSSREPQ